jgi:sugar phosphate isomerase/epimerase
MLANQAELEGLEDLHPHKIALVQLSDFMWRDIRSTEERIETASHLRVFPGQGSHSTELSNMLRRLDRGGYRGDFSLEVVNDDYLQLAPQIACERALTAAKWITDQVLRRSLQVRGYAGVTL